MSDLTRRTWLRASTAGTLVQLIDVKTHLLASPSPSPAPPGQLFFVPEEFAALALLCNLIIPADEHSADAQAAGAAQYIDLLSANNPKIALIFRGGLSWINGTSLRLYNKTFVESNRVEQTELLERIAHTGRTAPEYRVGAIFFNWARRMTVDAYYTSKVGISDLDYMGNSGSSGFMVPADVLDQARARFAFLESE